MTLHISLKHKTKQNLKNIKKQKKNKTKQKQKQKQKQQQQQQQMKKNKETRCNPELFQAEAPICKKKTNIWKPLLDIFGTLFCIIVLFFFTGSESRQSKPEIICF